MPRPFRPCILVPTYNHVNALPTLLRHMKSLGLPVVIVDDGSDAAAGRTIDGLVEAHASVWCVRHDRNRGKGAAMISGLREAAARGFSHAFQIDADGQHDLDRVAPMLEAARAHPDALLAGVPVFDGSIPRGRRIGRRITAFWVVIHTLSPSVGDPMCGFRVYPLSATLPLLRGTRLAQGMAFDIEILVRLRWSGAPVVALPVRVVYPPGNFSNFHMLRDNVEISLTHAQLFFGMLARLPRLLHGRLQRGDPGGPGGRHWAELGERGAYWGLWLLATIYRLLGRRACLVMMTPVVLYFFLTGREQRRASADYLQRLHATGHWPRPPGLVDQFRHFMSFGVSALDSVAAWSGNIPRSMLRGVDDDDFMRAETDPRGAFVLTAHLGNPEVLRAAAHLGRRQRVNVLTHTAHAERFNRLIARVAPDAPVRLVQVTELGIDKAIVLREAVERGEWVVSVADRIPVGASGRVCRVPLLGEAAPFPEGPFILAALLGAPVFTMFCLREGGAYRVWFEPLAERLVLPRREREERLHTVVEVFAARLEARLREAPLQWYNFFDFWHPQEGAPPRRDDDAR
jgi:predicted LPLAT superfamily acyltransferase